MSFHTGNKNIKPPEGRNTTKSKKTQLLMMIFP
jgi:hypothetical protein